MLESDEDKTNIRISKASMASGHTTNAVHFAAKLSEPLKTDLLIELLGAIRVMQYDGWGSTSCGGMSCEMDAVNCCSSMTEPMRTRELKKLHAELTRESSSKSSCFATLVEEALLDANKQYLTYDGLWEWHKLEENNNILAVRKKNSVLVGEYIPYEQTLISETDLKKIEKQ